MPVPVEYDILVVGAGPAGSSAAQASAAAGARTLLIDAKTRIGEQPHCGEFLPQRLFSEFHLDRACIVQAVETMETLVVDLPSIDTSPSGSIAGPHPFQLTGTVIESALEDGSWGKDVTLRQEILSPGFLVDRVRFDRDLARKAAFDGAMVLSSARLVGRERGEWIVKHAYRELRVRARFVIAADGPLSKVAEILKLKRPDMLKGIQVEVPLRHELDRTLVFLSRDMTGGYGWLFPKGLAANVGLGVVSDGNINAAELLHRLLEWLHALDIIGPGRLARTGGPIPVSGIRDPLVHGNIIFCGDAAGLTHPITGAGIPQAVFSGNLAGEAAAQSLTSGKATPLKDYAQEILGRYSGVIDHALSKRRLMMDRTDHPDFRDTCRQTWIAFKGYRKRVRPTKGSSAQIG